MNDLDRYLEEQLKDPEFREEYEKLQPEYEIMRSLIDARIRQNLTQKELSERSGIRQSNISRIERCCQSHGRNASGTCQRHGQKTENKL